MSLKGKIKAKRPVFKSRQTKENLKLFSHFQGRNHWQGPGGHALPTPYPHPPSHFNFRTSISRPSEKFLSVDHPKEDHKERGFKP